MEVVTAEGLENYNFKVYCTTQKFGNMRFSDSEVDVKQQVGKLREAVGYDKKILAPRPNMTNKIFDVDGETVNEGADLFRSKEGDYFDGAIVGSGLPFQAYALANADCPVGILFGKYKEETRITCMHLGFRALVSGILTSGLKMAHEEMVEVTGFFFGFGVGPEAYTFDLERAKKNPGGSKIISWLKAKEVNIKEGEESAVDLFDLTCKELKENGFEGKIIRESKFRCTASMTDTSGDHMFFSNRRDKGNAREMHRHCVLAVVE